MKHVKVLSNEVPVQAQETAWVELKNIVGGLALSPSRAAWVAAQVDQKLQG